MAKATSATPALEKAGIAFKVHEYDYDPNAERIGMQAAQALGIEPARLKSTRTRAWADRSGLFDNG
jgi:Cys-tRNA(Pro)/Cys-tRNA(Cys) deacylase